MNHERLKYLHCLSHNLVEYAGTASFSLKHYPECKDPTFLQIAAFGVYNLTKHIMMLYCLARELNCDLDASYDELVSLVSKSCEDGEFLALTDVSAWGRGICESSKPFDMSWDEFENQITSYARAMQSLYNDHVVQCLERRLEEPSELNPERRLSNFM